MSLPTATFGPASANLQVNVRQRYGSRMLIAAALLGLVVTLTGLLRPAPLPPHILQAVGLAILLLAFIPRRSPVFQMLMAVFGLTALAAGELLLSGPSSAAPLIFFAAVLVASFFVSTRAAVFLFLVSVVFGALTAVADLSGLGDPDLRQWAIAGLALAGLSLAAFVLPRVLSAGLRATLSRAGADVMQRERQKDFAEARHRFARSLSLIARMVGPEKEPDDLMREALDALRADADCNSAAYYAVDATGAWAELRVGSGDIASELEQTGYRIDLRGSDPVARAIREVEPVLAIEISDTLPLALKTTLRMSRTIAALPVAQDRRPQGAIALYSARPGAFSEADLAPLQELVERIGALARSAQLFHDTRRRLIELESGRREGSGRGAFPASSGEQRFEYAVGDAEFPQGSARLEVPLALRDQILGQISMATDQEWTPEQRQMIEAIAAQAALALENARLIENMQTSARRSEVLAEVSARLRATLDINTIVQDAAREYLKAFGLAEARISLEPQPAANREGT